MSLSLIEAARPETAVVLGSGLGSVAEAFGCEAQVAFGAIPGLGAATVPGHAGRFVLGRIEGRPVLMAQGRRHIYEGISAQDAAAGIRFMHGLGVRRVLLTNAAGALNRTFSVGGLMLITDHINLLGSSPLTGGPHFHDMSEVYHRAWRARILAAAGRLGMTLHQGVYAAVPGPQYETPAEIRMLGILGADAVGMSTVPEAIQARMLGMEVAGISMLTNWAAGLAPQTLSHEEVVQVGGEASTHLTALLRQAI